MFRFIGKFEFRPFSPSSRQAERVVSVLQNPDKRSTFLNQLRKRKPANYEIRENLLDRDLVASMSKPDSLRVGSYNAPLVRYDLIDYPQEDYDDTFETFTTPDIPIEEVLEYYNDNTYALPDTKLSVKLVGGKTIPAISSRVLSKFKPTMTSKRKSATKYNDIESYLLDGGADYMTDEMVRLIMEESRLRDKSPMEIIKSLTGVQQPLLQKVYKKDTSEAKIQNQYLRDLYDLDNVESTISQYDEKLLEDLIYNSFYNQNKEMTKPQRNITPRYNNITPEQKMINAIFGTEVDLT